MQRYEGSDQTLVKDLGGGEYLGFSCVDAFYEEDCMSVIVCRTKFKEDI